MRGNHKPFATKHMGTRGFSTLELVIVMFIILIISGIAIPSFMTMMHSARLKGAVSDAAGLFQAQRMRAVDDDRYYSTYLLAAAGNNPQQLFVDIYPQNVNGTSGTGGAAVNAQDPVVMISGEVSQQPAGAAPNTPNLLAQILPANSPVVPQDASLAATPVTFGPRGLPCTPQAVAGGTVCDSLGGPTAYWTFFQDNVTQNWGAVTISPAGRIRRWSYNSAPAGGTWVTY
jgi:type II secretory pathway pseudopilin PulG